MCRSSGLARIRSRSLRLASGDLGQQDVTWMTIEPGPPRKSRHANYLKEADLALKCPQCGRGYKVKPSLSKHLKYECGGRRNFSCELCGRSFTQNVSLRRHLMQSHNFFKPPRKPCGRKIVKSTNTEYILPSSKRNNKSVTTRRHNPVIFFYAFKVFIIIIITAHTPFSNFLLGAVLCRELHITTTYNKSKFSEFLKSPTSPATAVDLTIANSVPLNPNLLPLHLSMSSVPVSVTPIAPVAPVTQDSHWRLQDSKTYVCPDCGKGLSHRYTLERHRRTVCGKIRNTKGKWKCNFCTRRYESLGSLSRHNRFECGVPPKFFCIFCPKRFTQQCSLSRHLKKIHIDKTNKQYQ
ncbi:PREDICTED: zinc finger and SCAN domain-containing protein 10-like [Wasmannia auropunctata]|uniref:zinc finger and SCAN domain-containing protein 10-like n=1 Tax=Wasmannia auropunctata TaxID=64793 RepID=UPI0005F08AFC|nr:PREDICTED: zinc finger and SCAN domain-containing protein 10-like [Wasmannia auropunctata]